MKLKLIAVSILALQLGACSTIVNGSNQTIAFSTGNVTDADCNLTGGSNQAVNKTFTSPAEVKVPRSGKALNLECSKPGYMTAEKLIDGKVEESVGGNVIFGGFIGAGVDAATGAIYKYPSEVDLPLQAASGAVSAEPIAN